MSQEDPYNTLTRSLKAVGSRLDTLMKNHDEFVLQNVSIINNVSSLPKFKKDITEGISASHDDGKSADDTRMTKETS